MFENENRSMRWLIVPDQKVISGAL